MKRISMTKEKRTVIKGIAAASRKLGCSQTHLSRVMSGNRVPGSELRKKLERMGVRFNDETGLVVL